MEAVLTLPPALDSAWRARRFLARALADAGVGADDAWTVTLVAHELVTNAVQHARTDFDLRLTVGPGTVHLAVRDDNPRRPVLEPPPRFATSGRGLELVSSLADEWGVDADDVRKVVWAVVSVREREDEHAGPGRQALDAPRGRAPERPPPLVPPGSYRRPMLTV